MRILEPLRHRNFRLLWIGQSVSQVGFYFAAFTVALPLLVADVLHGTAATFGLIEAAQGVGEVLAGLLAGNLRVRRIGLALYAGNALLGLSAAGFGVGLLPVVLFAAAGFGAIIVFSNTLWDSAVQKHVPGELIGHVTRVDSVVTPLLSRSIRELE